MNLPDDVNEAVTTVVSWAFGSAPTSLAVRRMLIEHGGRRVLMVVASSREAIEALDNTVGSLALSKGATLVVVEGSACPSCGRMVVAP